jgi:phosphoglucosamine mutase
MKKRTYFGTDGVRGIANGALSPQFTMHLGMAAAMIFTASDTHPTVVIGTDTRRSCPMLEAALTAGLCSMGIRVVSGGVLPTPAVARITRSIGANAGAVISASHNPFDDNGIKFFGPDGYKLDDALEIMIEERLATVDHVRRPVGADVGVVERDCSLGDLYASHLEETVGNMRFDGLRVLLDCANGAASSIAPRIFRDLGADVVVINACPDGLNINRDCGSLHPKNMLNAVVETRADIGVAFDGDADRAILGDETGALISGDQVMAVCGRDLACQGRLSGNTVVGTVMSNMGLARSLGEIGVSLLRTAVGDRYVSERMRQDGFVLGGERSGHVIFGDLTTTGDGILTALQVIKVLRSANEPMSALASVMHDFPQRLVSIHVSDRQAWEHDDELMSAIDSAKCELGDQGRLNVRASGTEQLVRVMVEAEDDVMVESISSNLAQIIRGKWGVK